MFWTFDQWVRFWWGCFGIDLDADESGVRKQRVLVIELPDTVRPTYRSPYYKPLYDNSLWSQFEFEGVRPHEMLKRDFDALCKKIRSGYFAEASVQGTELTSEGRELIELVTQCGIPINDATLKGSAAHHYMCGQGHHLKLVSNY